MRLKLISCEIFHREMCAVVARSPHRVDIEFLPKWRAPQNLIHVLRESQQPGMARRLSMKKHQ